MSAVGLYIKSTSWYDSATVLVHMISKEKNKPKGYACNRSKQLPDKVRLYKSLVHTITQEKEP